MKHVAVSCQPENLKVDGKGVPVCGLHEMGVELYSGKGNDNTLESAFVPDSERSVGVSE